MREYNVLVRLCKRLADKYGSDEIWVKILSLNADDIYQDVKLVLGVGGWVILGWREVLVG